MQLPSFVEVRPGELLYSALARHTTLRGTVGPKAQMRELYGLSSVIATVDLPCHLAALLDRLPEAAGWSADRLIQHHTLLPYYTAFQTADIAKEACRGLLGSGASMHLKLGLAAFRTGKPSTLQFCPRCLTQMSQMWGTFHWVREHQLPGVLVCPDHGTRLRRSTVHLAQVNRHAYVPATRETCPANAPAVTSDTDDQARRKLQDLACASKAVLLASANPAHRYALRDHYRSELQRVGLIKGKYKVNQVELAGRLSEYWGDALDRLSGVALSGRLETWLASLVRTSSGAQPPLQHLLLRMP